MESKDLQSTWCSTSVQTELGVDKHTATPDGGTSSGLLSGAAAGKNVWPRVAVVAPTEEKQASQRASMAVYTEAGEQQRDKEPRACEPRE